LKGQVLDRVTLDVQEHGDLVAAQRVVALRLAVDRIRHAEVPRPLVVIEDHFLVQVS